MARWSIDRIIKELDVVKQTIVQITSSTSATSADAVSVTPSGNLSSTDVQSALEELQGDIDTLSSGSILTYTKTFGNVFTDTILNSEHGLSTIHNVIIKTSGGDVISADVNILGTTVIINSNISLLNHTLLIY